MFSIKIFHFIKGYVILSLSGHNKEEFLNEILKLGVRPRNITCRGGKIYFEADAADFFLLRKSPVRAEVHIERKRGAAFVWARLKRRRALFIGMLAAVLTFAAGAQFVWSVEYDCPADCDTEKLAAAAELAGLKPGTPKRRLPEPIEMKNIILSHTDGISWCWVYIKGTRAVVKVRQSISAPELFDPNVPCDIVAMRPGIIYRITAKNGRTTAAENQAVAAGDTLISGTYEFENSPGYQVHARGTAEAYTEHTKTGTYKQYYCYKIPTGRRRTTYSLRIYRWELPLYIGRKIPYEEYDREEKLFELSAGRGNYLGIGIRRVRLSEYITEKEPLSLEATVELAKNELEAQISHELLPPAELVDKNVSYEQQDAETVTVTVTMNFIEQIGTEKRIEEVTFIEPKTDRSAAGD